ncbi:CesT family type III secretion system chaperone [uncultured Methylobacterium sp.]|uniref:CesT family type III secretion system chaperone n=1 Tax=uncultured Methylobacterium sp. TaxID=157278 RepID=UPI002604918B|nr:CesT family type III secretion system chaperone [uncultured Methylobacterium sp.]
MGQHTGRLLAELGDLAGIDLTPDPEGVATVLLDGVRISLECPEESPFLYLHAALWRLGPDRGREIEEAMRANLFGLPLSGAWLALDGTSDEVVLCSAARSAGLAPDDLAALIEATAVAARDLQARRTAPDAEAEVAPVLDGPGWIRI